MLLSVFSSILFIIILYGFLFSYKMDEDAEMRRIQNLLEEVEVSSSEDEETVEGDVLASDSEGEDYLEVDEHVPNCYESDTDDLPDQPQWKKPKIDGWKGKDKT